MLLLINGADFSERPFANRKCCSLEPEDIKRQQQQQERQQPVNSSISRLQRRLRQLQNQDKPLMAAGNLPATSKSDLSVLIKSLVLFSILMILLSSVGCVVVYQVRFIATKNGRTDYALAGESIELSCHYIMRDEAEEIKQIIWSKDGKNIFKWNKNKPGIQVLSHTFKGHVDPLSVNSHITMHNVTIDMHGKYKCWIKTDLNNHEMEQDLIVISQSNCKLNDWRVQSSPGECREQFRLDCRNMFPKPVPSCGLWNGKLDKFIRSVMVDISEEPNKQTYRVHYMDKFELLKPSATVNVSSGNVAKQQQQQQQQMDSALEGNSIVSNPHLHSDLIQYAGHLMFKCDISVPETSWKLSLVHRMFDFNDGCNQDPLETIERMRQNYSHYAASRIQEAGYLVDRQLDDFEMLSSTLKYEILAPKLGQQVELNCWRKPRIGSLARLSCASKTRGQVQLMGANLLECQPTGWVPVSKSVSATKQQQTVGKKLHNRRPPKRRDESADPLPRAAAAAAASLQVNSNSVLDLEEQISVSEKPEISTEFPSESNPQRSGSNLPQSQNDVDLSHLEEQEQQTVTTELPFFTPTEVELFIPTTTATTSSQEPILGSQLESQQQLTPAQLASLLPTCVSTRRYNSAANTITGNRLPLRDEVQTLESLSGHRNRISKLSPVKNVKTGGSRSSASSMLIGTPTLTLILTLTISFLGLSTQILILYNSKNYFKTVRA